MVTGSPLFTYHHRMVLLKNLRQPPYPGLVRSAAQILSPQIEINPLGLDLFRFQA